ncbi:hypothetical protein GGS20DRAFT_366811 [Poronia punctata]|nr:hypothetical protein GGS20DRAFT_366811 [Poronia punctata]
MTMDTEQADDTQQIGPPKPFICTICKKTFEQEASCRRHYYYCRSKPPDTKGSRRRSCTGCVRAKARCVWTTEVGLEACARCQKRGVECEFETTARKPGQSPGIDNNAVIGPQPIPDDYSESSSSVGNTDPGSLISSSSNQAGEVQEHTVVIPYTETYHPTIMGHHHEPLLYETSFFDFDEPTHMLGGIDDVFLRYPGDHNNNTMSVACEKIKTLPLNRTGGPNPWLYQPTDTSLFSPRPFVRQDHISLASLAMRHLRSFPFMMLVRGRLPPFINRPTCPWGPQDETHRMPQALVNCAMLVQSFNSNSATNRNWAWGKIWLEQEKILAEALLVYCLLRLSDTPTGHAVFDVGMLSTVNLVSQALATSVGQYFDCSLPEDPALAWRDWVFVESRRRTVLIFQILGLLVDISTAVSYLALGGLVLVPLPSTSTLWSTQNFDRWKTEYKFWHDSHIVYGLSERGALMKLQGTEDGVVTNEADWEAWSAEVGELGGLVMIIGELLRNQ